MIMGAEMKKFTEALKDRKESGQAIFEFIIFLPLIIYLFTVLTNVGDAINGSINQQKSVRGYFYGSLRGNSYPISHKDLTDYSEKGITGAGLVAFGWREKGDDGGQNFSACYPFLTFMGMGNKDETCEEPIVQDRKTSIIRVATLYGLCGEYFSATGSTWQHGMLERSATFCRLSR
jgi:hypothetical protein